jgi:hypothetical protein
MEKAAGYTHYEFSCFTASLPAEKEKFLRLSPISLFLLPEIEVDCNFCETVTAPFLINDNYDNVHIRGQTSGPSGRANNGQGRAWLE